MHGMYRGILKPDGDARIAESLQERSLDAIFVVGPTTISSGHGASMSLVPFHRVLIGSAIAFGTGFGIWQLRIFLREGSTGALLGGVSSLLVAAAFGFYLIRLRHFLKLPEAEQGRTAR